jgi:hypothetical protein
MRFYHDVHAFTCRTLLLLWPLTPLIPICVTRLSRHMRLDSTHVGHGALGGSVSLERSESSALIP